MCWELWLGDADRPPQLLVAHSSVQLLEQRAAQGQEEAATLRALDLSAVEVEGVGEQSERMLACQL